ncbi:hypothetical protein [Trinickia diaoshuihuensis]|uniref:hypothetical protein n=1 Tax=Trinickia diaoshuihuensis TaxID=2292265 RepID=UPI0013C3602F|nr:hypothetical protein [Trinickia diaoshuihuensis]
MAKPVCCVLIPETLEQAFPLVVALLEGLGVSLAHPDNSRITTWTEEGDQKEIVGTDVVGQVVSGAISNVQFWKTGSEDVFVAWKENSGGCRFSFYLDGVDAVFAAALTSKLAETVLETFRFQYGEGAALTIEFE